MGKLLRAKSQFKCITFAKGLKFWARLFRSIQAPWQLTSIRSVGHRRVDPAPGIDFIKQQLEGIVGRDGYLHRLSRSSISAIEQLANCSNPRSLVLRFQHDWVRAREMGARGPGNAWSSGGTNAPRSRQRWHLVNSRNSGGRGRHHRLNAGQSRLQRGFLGVVERCLQYGTAFTLQTFEHLVRCNLAHQDK